MPEVSVVIPTHNRAEFLRPAIQSVLAQTFQDFEIIIIDDGSTDDTQNIVRNFVGQRIQYVRHEMNHGEAFSRNAGILSAKGKYIAFLDDDDEWLPEKLELQVRALESQASKVGLMYAGYFEVKRSANASNTIIRQVIPEKRGNVSHDIMIKNFIGTPSTVLIRREVTERVGLFDPNIAYGLDYDFWIRISRHFHFEYIEEPLVKYHIHEYRLSNNLGVMIQGVRDMGEKYGRDFLLNNRYYRNRFLKLGDRFYLRGDSRSGRKAFLSSIKLNPVELRAYFYFGFTFLGAQNYLRLRKLGRKLLAHLRLEE